MAWQTPKLNWHPADPLTDTDMNRIEGNTDYLKTDLDNHKNSNNNVHGVSGNVVGTSDTQTLTNKTLGSGNKLGANLDASNYTIVNLKAPVNAADAARKADVDAVNNTLTNHTSAASGVHGITGNVVGTSDTQTILNKTLGSGNKLGADFNANSYKITNLAAPTSANDAARKTDVDAVNTSLSNHMSATSAHGVSGNIVGTSDAQTITNKTLGSGSKLGADLNANSHKITNLAAPVNANDAARKTDVDTASTNLTNALNTHAATASGVHGVSGNIVGTSDTQTLTNKTLGSGTVLAADLNANSNKIINLAAPTSANDAATKGYIDSNFVKLTDYEDADVLAKIKNVDGSGSGLDADMLDGYHASSFVKTSDYDDTDVLAKIKNVDGSGSGLDADLLDGYHSSDFILTTGGTITGNLTVEGLLKGILTGHPLKSYSYDDTVHKYWTKVGQFQSASYAHLAILVIGKHDFNYPHNLATIVHFSKHRDISYSASVVQFGNVGGLEIKATIDENGGLWVYNPVFWGSNIQFYVLRKYNVDVYTDASIFQEAKPTSWVADPRNSIRLARQPDGSYIVANTYKPHYNFPDNVQIERNTVWHAGNDGSGSGLDADLLDGKHASDFAKANLSDLPTYRTTASSVTVSTDYVFYVSTYSTPTFYMPTQSSSLKGKVWILKTTVIKGYITIKIGTKSYTNASNNAMIIWNDGIEYHWVAVQSKSDSLF